MFGFKAKPLTEEEIDGYIDLLKRRAQEDGGDGTIFVFHDSRDMRKGGTEFQIREGKVPARAERAIRRSLAGKRASERGREDVVVFQFDDRSAIGKISP